MKGSKVTVTSSRNLSGAREVVRILHMVCLILGLCLADFRIEDRDFQLITWAKDHTVRIWPMEQEVLQVSGYVSAKLTSSVSAIVEVYRSRCSFLGATRWISHIHVQSCFRLKRWLHQPVPARFPSLPVQVGRPLLTAVHPSCRYQRQAPYRL